MMARQEILFAEAISGIKRALNRKDDGNTLHNPPYNLRELTQSALQAPI